MTSATTRNAASRRAIPAGRRIPRVEPGSPQWLKLMTGSKIAAVCGLSTWDSPFSLWHRMAGTIEADPEDRRQNRGHRLEDAVCRWWADQYPGMRMRRAGTFVHRDRPWQGATPDRLAVDTATGKLIVIEAKTSASDDEWGEPGTDEIPPYYKCQVIWTLDTLGLDTAALAVLGARLEFREYAISWDAEDAEFMRGKAEPFLASLEAGEAPPLDGHDQTYKALRRLHPDIDGSKVEIDPALAYRYRRAVSLFDVAEDEKKRSTALLLDAMGQAKYARRADNGELVATRSPGRGGAVRLNPHRTEKKGRSAA